MLLLTIGRLIPAFRATTLAACWVSPLYKALSNASSKVRSTPPRSKVEDRLKLWRCSTSQSSDVCEHRCNRRSSTYRSWISRSRAGPAHRPTGPLGVPALFGIATAGSNTSKSARCTGDATRREGVRAMVWRESDPDRGRLGCGVRSYSRTRWGDALQSVCTDSGFRDVPLQTVAQRTEE